jgi:uncharacterized membrane protein
LGLPRDAKVRHSITIRRPAEEIFTFWRSFENLALFFKDVASITQVTPTRSHWKVKLSNGAEAEWDADIVQEVAGRLISSNGRNGAL